MSSIGAAILFLCHAYIGTRYCSLIIIAKAKAIVSHSVVLQTAGHVQISYQLHI